MLKTVLAIAAIASTVAADVINIGAPTINGNQWFGNPDPTSVSQDSADSSNNMPTAAPVPVNPGGISGPAIIESDGGNYLSIGPNGIYRSDSKTPFPEHTLAAQTDTIIPKDKGNSAARNGAGAAAIVVALAAVAL